VRQLEARAGQAPRVGRAKRPERQSIVDLAQQAGSGLPGRTLAEVEPMKGRMQVRGYWLGLTGPMGPLPIHLVRICLLRTPCMPARSPFGDWLDLISRADAAAVLPGLGRSTACAHADRPKDDKFSGWLAALSGCSGGRAGGAATFPRARVHYAAAVSWRCAARLPSKIRSATCSARRLPCQEFQPRWRHFEREDLSRLGKQLLLPWGKMPFWVIAC
jgi:predicted component of type VI protein secretion system